jgi:16S rRNA (cytosine1402-N4)-methyltransferase
MEEFRHLSVLADEVLALLAPRSGGIYLDGTLGGGGHAELVLAASAPDGRLLGLDQDDEALAAAAARLAPFGKRCRMVKRNFSELATVLAEEGIEAVDGILLDLGVSSHQLDTAARGFSFQADAPLDMRMDQAAAVTAAELVNSLPEAELARIIREYGEERWAKRIAAFVVTARQEAPLATTRQLADLVRGAIPRACHEDRIHPATRTFQALRIAVNDELGVLERGLAAALQALRPGGRLAVISFHSLEDRIVKHRFREWALDCHCPKGLPICQCGAVPLVRVLTGRPVTAGDAELAENPRARSAKLRAAEKR